MKILVVEDDPTSRKVLCAILKKLGHDSVTAENGAEAQDAFARDEPDLVLMDVMMPVMDGYEAATRIKRLAGARFVPIVFVTALTDDQALAKCVECGGDDFLPKPYNRVLIKAKIDAMARIRDLYEQTRRHRDALARDRVRIEEDLRLARRVFDYAGERGVPRGLSVGHFGWAVGRWSGDFALYAEAPGGRLHALLGDFTGHGLVAAVGALPAADLFYDLTAAGEPIGSIAAQMSGKLRRCLPLGYFCAAALVSIARETGEVEVWNGGIPTVMVLDADGRPSRRLASGRVPLGVLPADRVDRTTDRCALGAGGSLLLATDGLTEAQDRAGRPFGSAGVDEALIASGSRFDAVETVRRRIMEFLDGQVPHDDVSVLHLRPLGAEPAERSRRQAVLMTEQSAYVSLPGRALATTEPMDILAAWPGIAALPQMHRGRACTVLSELVTNAIDYGLLSLDSNLKSSAEGLDAYYHLRRDRLARQDEGYVNIVVERLEQEDGLSLSIRVEDSGPGFDPPQSGAAPTGVDQYRGRGISLVRAMTAKLSYLGLGNVAETEYRAAA